MLGYLEKGIQTPMAQDRSTKIISMIKWIRTSRLSMKNSLSTRPLPWQQSALGFRVESSLGSRVESGTHRHLDD